MVIQTQAPPGPTPQADTTAPLLSYFKAAAHRIKNLKALSMLASCNEGCTLKAVAKLGKKTLGSKTLQLQAGFPTQVKIKLSRTGLAALRAKLRNVRAVMVTIQFTLTDPAGNAAPATKKSKGQALGRSARRATVALSSSTWNGFEMTAAANSSASLP